MGASKEYEFSINVCVKNYCYYEENVSLPHSPHTLLLRGVACMIISMVDIRRQRQQRDKFICLREKGEDKEISEKDFRKWKKDKMNWRNCKMSFHGESNQRQKNNLERNRTRIF